jgi:predicted dehydrogenase
MCRVKLGLVGLGSVSQRGILPHLAQEDARAKVELVAVCDVVAERARETARRYGVPEAYSDYAEMLARADIEAVAIATPIGLHYAQTMAALEAGKHVYVQKAMTTTLAEATRVVETARRLGRKLVASPGQVLNPTIQRVRRLIQEGVIGKVYWAFGANMGAGHEYEAFRAGDDVLHNVDPSWYYQRPGGGPLYDMAVYSLHTLTTVLGPARRVSAFSGIGLRERRWKDKIIPVEMDDNTLVLLDFGENTFGLVAGQNCHAGRRLPWGAIGFYGSDGAIELGSQPPEITVLSRRALSGTLGFSQGAFIASTAHERPPYVTGPHLFIPEAHVYADIMHLVECILEDRPPLVTGEQARHVVEIMEKAYLSAQTGQTYTLETTFPVAEIEARLQERVKV